MGECSGLERTDFFTVSTLGGSGCLKGTDFEQFLLWEGVVFLIELIVYSFNLGVCDGLEGTDFSQFLLWEEVLVLKELICNSFFFGMVWWS